MLADVRCAGTLMPENPCSRLSRDVVATIVVCNVRMKGPRPSGHELHNVIHVNILSAVCASHSHHPGLRGAEARAHSGTSYSSDAAWFSRYTRSPLSSTRHVIWHAF